MCSIGRIVDPLNISGGKGEQLANPFGGWKTKIDPAGIMTPKQPEYVQKPATPTGPTQQEILNAQNREQMRTNPVRSNNPLAGMQITL